jgi:hypothetical protein
MPTWCAIGLWLGPEIAKDHGVLSLRASVPPNWSACCRSHPSRRWRFAQRPPLLTDIGVWLLSDKAVRVLMNHALHQGQVAEYDLYGTFGCALGTNPRQTDEEVAQLSVAVLPLPGASSTISAPPRTAVVDAGHPESGERPAPYHASLSQATPRCLCRMPSPT